MNFQIEIIYERESAVVRKLWIILVRRKVIVAQLDHRAGAVTQNDTLVMQNRIINLHFTNPLHHAIRQSAREIQYIGISNLLITCRQILLV